MNAFASYAEQAIPPSVQRRQAKAEAKAAKPLSELDKKMLEKQRLSKAYRAWVRSHRTEVLSAEPRLRDFLRYLRTVKADQGDELIEQITTSWLPASPQPVRLFALQLVDRHANKLVRQMGGEALNDPMPPEPTVYFRARDVLHAEGRA